MSDTKPILELRNITKIYPGVTALDDVSIEIEEGEIHAIVGENGAGKSTLIKTCTGAVVPSGGKIIINGESFTEMNPKLSVEKGIAAIYQEFNLVGQLSVAENIFLGRAIRKGMLIDRGAMVKESKKIFDQFHMDIDPNKLVSELTVGYQQIVEIAKAMSQNAKVLIMDEPSAPLTRKEAEAMYQIVHQLKAAGVTVIYISHRMDEIFKLSDRITVLRDGKKIETLMAKETNLDQIVKRMVGRELKENYPKRSVQPRDRVIFQVDGLTGNGVKDISFQLKEGEVLGIGGLIGAGRTELAELLFGAKLPESGKIYLKEKEIFPKTPRQAIDYGIAYVPEDRKGKGALLDIDIRGNISISILNRLAKFFVVDEKEENRIAESYKESIRIKTPNLEEKMKHLSGGNQQKVIIAKWLATNPEVIILDEPTRGIDVGAKLEIYKLINSLVESGKTILMISSEMEELMGMSDRILVLSEGKIAGTLSKDEFCQEKIMTYASIVSRKE
ncbi:monosaccharide ABC transporter ATP-binding protein, CUT2 family [Tindallia magadiensis]|uniref:Monosaccharide ABC transporter ATP-binding protein, CUT2 family n=1 Tax=Tindallia magadiensis TaxID=69895 RepID=A0A1I3D6L0_9FIRM|nr:sugar ABC transporter ATP-binding protein [Tindallia magadiensis]SFH82151.1 monosaccharide ABC transporter ATP-binding protein, CUT2 family [Tindallia magadiensis]